MKGGFLMSKLKTGLEVKTIPQLQYLVTFIVFKRTKPFTKKDIIRLVYEALLPPSHSEEISSKIHILSPNIYLIKQVVEEVLLDLLKYNFIQISATGKYHIHREKPKKLNTNKYKNIKKN